MTTSSITPRVCALLVLAATAQAHATPVSDVDKELRRLATYGADNKPDPQFAVEDLEIEPADHL